MLKVLNDENLYDFKYKGFGNTRHTVTFFLIRIFGALSPLRCLCSEIIYIHIAQ
jgi:hypothetical protein